MADDNTELGRFDLIGIPAAPRGIPQIEVTFDIDSNGIIHVSAKDLGTGKEQAMRITAPEKLSKEDIEKYVKEAEKFADQDKKRKEDVELHNQADTLVYSTEKSLNEYSDKVSSEDRENIQKKLAELKDALKGSDSELIKKNMEELTKAAHKLAEVIYKEAAAKQQKGAGPQPGAEQPGAEEGKEKPGEKKGDDVIDAEYKVENEDKDKK
jgi:molecular chaperone DnaK